MKDNFASDESGMAMALAVIMVALLGVMGAGLLVFVNTDLGAVVETNQGQRAFEMADAGVKAAGHQLDNSQTSGRYNGDAGGGDPADYQWSLCYGKMPAACATSPAPGVTLTDLDGDGNVSGGTLDSVTVTIRQITANNTFKVVSTGEYGNAKRRIEAIYQTQDFSVPMAYFTSNVQSDSVDIRCSATITNMSLFAMGGILVKSKSPVFFGTDPLYGDWYSPFNATPRRNPVGSSTPVTAPGMASVKKIEAKNLEYGGDDETNNTALCPSGSTADIKFGTRDFDGVSSYPGSRFVQTPANPQGSSQITFPFDTSEMPIEGNAAAQAADAELIAELKARAQADGTYIENPAGGKISSWPANSTYDTVVYVKYPANTGEPDPLTWDVPGSCDVADVKKGILVLEQARLVVPANKAPFSGITFVRGADENSHQNTFNSNANSCWEGPVNADGETTIAGRAGFFLPGVNPNAVYSGLRGAELMSWREVYN